MARDFEDIHGIDDLSDDELRDLVRQHLAAHNLLDVDGITVKAAGGRVTLEGRVGTDGERQVAEHVVTDTLGLTNVTNDLVVDPLRRAEAPAAIDDHLAAEDREEGLLLGDRPVPHNDEAEHLADDDDSRLFGTTDVQKSTQEGTAWIPPESPTPEGLGREGVGEDH